MQLQELLLVLILFIIVPVLIIFYNHNVFFTVMAVILFVSSIRNSYILLLKRHTKVSDQNDLLAEEMEDTMNFDMKKFGIGTKVVKNLIIVLFLIYCIFFIRSLYLKLYICAVSIYWIRTAVNCIEENKETGTFLSGNIFSRLPALLVNISILVIIILTSADKLFEAGF